MAVRVAHDRFRRLVVPTAALGLLAAVYACLGADPDAAPAGGDAANAPDPSKVDGSVPTNPTHDPSDGAAPVGDAGDAGEEEDAGPCIPDLGCAPTNPCKTGRTTCVDGKRACAETGNIADGTACNVTSICRAGACNDPTWALWPMPSWADAGIGPYPTLTWQTAFETAVDNVTGLVWLDNGPTAQTWTAAKQFCENANSFGYSDWRLPTVIELVSIADFYRSGEIAKPLNGGGPGLWSATPVATVADSHWSVKGFDPKPSSDVGPFDVKCVH